MKDIKELVDQMQSLIEQNELVMERVRDHSGHEILKLVVSPMSEYVAPVIEGKSDSISIMRRLVLSPLYLDVLKRFSVVSPKVASFLDDVQVANQHFSKPGGEARFEAFSDSNTKVVKVFFVDAPLAIQKGMQAMVSRHAMIPKEETMTQIIDAGLLKLAALVAVPVSESRSKELEHAFTCTQSFDMPWTSNPNAVSLVGPARSSMDGDLFVMDGKPSMVAMVGFKDINLFDPVENTKPRASRNRGYEAESMSL